MAECRCCGRPFPSAAHQHTSASTETSCIFPLKRGRVQGHRAARGMAQSVVYADLKFAAGPAPTVPDDDDSPYENVPLGPMTAAPSPGGSRDAPSQGGGRGPRGDACRCSSLAGRWTRRWRDPTVLLAASLLLLLLLLVAVVALGACCESVTAAGWGHREGSTRSGRGAGRGTGGGVMSGGRAAWDWGPGLLHGHHELLPTAYHCLPLSITTFHFPPLSSHSQSHSHFPLPPIACHFLPLPTTPSRCLLIPLIASLSLPPIFCCLLPTVLHCFPISFPPSAAFPLPPISFPFSSHCYPLPLTALPLPPNPPIAFPLPPTAPQTLPLLPTVSHCLPMSPLHLPPLGLPFPSHWHPQDNLHVQSDTLTLLSPARPMPQQGPMPMSQLTCPVPRLAGFPQPAGHLPAAHD